MMAASANGQPPCRKGSLGVEEEGCRWCALEACRPTDICTSDNFVARQRRHLIKFTGQRAVRICDYIPVQYGCVRLVRIVALTMANGTVTSIVKVWSFSYGVVACQANVHERLHQGSN